MLKKFAQAALFVLLSTAFVIPSHAMATSTQQSLDAVSPTATTTQVATFTNLTKGTRFLDSEWFYLNTPGYITVNVTQSNKSYTPIMYYRILRDNPDGTSTFFGTAEITGEGSLSFTSKKELPIGQYYIRFNSNQYGKTSGTISVTTP